MWFVYSMNFHLRGVGFNDCNRDIVKKYSKDEVATLKSLTSKGFIQLCDLFLSRFPLKYGNIFHGSSHAVLKNLKADAESAYVLVQESVYSLLCEFLDHKLKYGSVKEKQMYDGMSACDLVDRLLTKRCVSYFGRNENYLLPSGERGQGDFSLVGTDQESAPLLMDSCLTREEIKLTGFLLISSKVTEVVRDKSFSVVKIGIPFPTLDREGLFDWEDIVVTRRQNISKKGYGPVPNDTPEDSELMEKFKMREIWSHLYGHKRPLFSGYNRIAFPKHGRFKGGRDEREDERIPRFWKLPHMSFVDLQSLTVRLSLISMAILQEGNKRASAENRMAYLVIDKNKIGLGDSPAVYETIFLRNFAYEFLCQYRYLNNTFAIHFIEFTETRSLANGSKMYLSDGVFGNTHPNEGVEIKYSRRSEFRLEDVPEEYLIVETYRLEANALPGNELWMGKVSKDYSHPSFDVRHTGIPFIHNPLINHTRLCGKNLHAYDWYGVKPWKDLFAVNN